MKHISSLSVPGTFSLRLVLHKAIWREMQTTETTRNVRNQESDGIEKTNRW